MERREHAESSLLEGDGRSPGELCADYFYVFVVFSVMIEICISLLEGVGCRKEERNKHAKSSLLEGASC